MTTPSYRLFALGVTVHDLEEAMFLVNRARSRLKNSSSRPPHEPVGW
jgi:hypothetical protein